MPIPWTVHTLRLTTFHLSAPPADWRDFTGDDPETRTEQPRSTLRVEEGPFGTGRLTLTRRAGRVDLVLTAPESQSLDVLGTYEEVSEPFLLAARRWLGTGFPTTRLAYGVIGLMPVGTKADGYRTLQQSLNRVHLHPSEISDFLYQINYPVTSRVDPTVSLNRLAKWSVSAEQLLELSVGANAAISVAASPPDQAMSIRFAARLELDFSSAPQGMALAEPGRLFDELVQQAAEILEQGEQALNRGEVQS